MSGPADRRMFLRLLSLGLSAPLIAACNAQGTPGMLQLLDLVGTKNEKLERWLLSRAGNDRVKAGVRVAGAKFPSYFISDSVPTWDPAVSGAWQLVVDGAVRTPLRLDLAQPTRDAGYVDFSSFDEGYHESWDIESTMHPQTMVAIAKDGHLLSPRYGAPARVHSPVKLGYKNTKYLTRITFMPKANGGYWSDLGYEWYGGT